MKEMIHCQVFTFHQTKRKENSSKQFEEKTVNKCQENPSTFKTIGVNEKF